MKKIKIIRDSDVIVGCLRISSELESKILKHSKKMGVSKQKIIRTILENCIDDIEFD